MGVNLKLILIGLATLVAPIVMAFGSSLIHHNSMFDEGAGSGTYLWFLMMSIPLGLILIVIGIIMAAIKKFRSR